MHPISESILRAYQVRKTPAQKAAFRAYLREALEPMGYRVREEEAGRFIQTVNVVVGDIAKARYIFTAHYDTCARLPFPNLIAPESLLLTLLFQLLPVLGMMAAGICVGVAVGLLTGSMLLSAFSVWAVMVFLGWWMLLGPANPHTANDNTSGVTVLTEALTGLPDAARENAAFVLFDREEQGLIGSARFKRRHGRALSGKLLVNFDCVSDGDHLLLVTGKGLAEDEEVQARLRAALETPPGKTAAVLPPGRALYPSDQMHFDRGVGVVALARKWGVRYLGRIHTARDTHFDRANIEALRGFVIRLSMSDFAQDE